MASKKAPATKANPPTPASKTSAKKAPAGRAQARPPAAARGSSGTGASNESYALVSVLYHALQGADTMDRYIEDAQAADDEELVSFFEETKALYAARATEAKTLLASRLDAGVADDEDGEDGEDDDEEEEDDDDDEDEDEDEE